MVRFPRYPDSARRALRDSSGATGGFGLISAAALLPLSEPILDGITAPVLILAAFLPVLLIRAPGNGNNRRGPAPQGRRERSRLGGAQCVAMFGVLSVTTKNDLDLPGLGTQRTDRRRDRDRRAR